MIAISTADYQRTFKILVLGDASVGKTSLVQRFVHGKFENQYLMTVGFEPYTRFETINGIKFCYSLWDVAGDSKFAAMRKMFFNGATGALIGFDLTRADTFESVITWIAETKTEAPESLIILVGNKNDLPDEREVPTEAAQARADELGCISYLETSALTGENVADAFNFLGVKLLEKYG